MHSSSHDVIYEFTFVNENCRRIYGRIPHQILTIEATGVSVGSFQSPTQKETNISYPLASPSHYVLYVRSARMSELSRFVCTKSHVILHVILHLSYF